MRRTFAFQNFENQAAAELLDCDITPRKAFPRVVSLRFHGARFLATQFFVRSLSHFPRRTEHCLPDLAFQGLMLELDKHHVCVSHMELQLKTYWANAKISLTMTLMSSVQRGCWTTVHT